MSNGYLLKLTQLLRVNYRFDLNFMYLIREDKRIDVLKEVLNLCVIKEDYEMASILRDHIQSL